MFQTYFLMLWKKDFWLIDFLMARQIGSVQEILDRRSCHFYDKKAYFRLKWIVNMQLVHD